MASLVSHMGALGDFITTLPSIGVWRRLHPGEALVLLGRPIHAQLCGGVFDEVLDAGSARFASLYGPGPDVRLADRLRSFSSALLFTRADSPLAANLASLGVRGIRTQEPFPAHSASGDVSAVHVVDYHLSLFPDAALAPSDRVPRIEPPDDRAADARAVRAGTVAIHPGSGSARKNWPLDRFIELACAIAARGSPIAWILGPAERGAEIGRAFERALHGIADAELWREIPLPALAARLSRCTLFVGNDSGASHLAAAVGCPSVVLFGSSSPAVWAPRGERVAIVKCEGMEAIGVNRVLRVLEDVRTKR
jgi:ADP-heptose:LPS heptosyltransferase